MAMDGTGHAEAAEEEAWAAVYSAIDRAFEPGSSLEIPTAQLQAVKEVQPMAPRKYPVSRAPPRRPPLTSISVWINRLAWAHWSRNTWGMGWMKT